MNKVSEKTERSPRLLLTLLPGLAPLFIYILVDSLFGERIGIATAVAFGIIEFTLLFIKEKRSDLFILADTALLVALGLVSLAMESPFMVKMKPALFELIAALLFAFLALLPQQKSSAFLQRVLRAKDLPLVIPGKLCWILAILSFIHSGIVLFAAAKLSNFWWIVATTSYYTLPFIVLIPPLLLKIFRPLLIRLRYQNDEWFDIVTPEGKVTGSMPRTLCHKGPGLLHPVVHLFVFDSQKRILLQKRSLTKSIQPGKWDSSVGGHVMAGEAVDRALYRETEEELGIRSFTPRFLYRYLWEYEIESELVFTFATVYEDTFHFNRNEIDDIQFFTFDQIESGAIDVTPNLRHEIVLLKRAMNQAQS